MASIIFVVGTSHTPMLNAAAEEWPLLEELDRQRSHLHKDGRRATYDELLPIANTAGMVNPQHHALLCAELDLISKGSGLLHLSRPRCHDFIPCRVSRSKRPMRGALCVRFGRKALGG
jgi:hypothetical protein